MLSGGEVEARAKASKPVCLLLSFPRFFLLNSGGSSPLVGRKYGDSSLPQARWWLVVLFPEGHRARHILVPLMMTLLEGNSAHALHSLPLWLPLREPTNSPHVPHDGSKQSRV